MDAESEISRFMFEKMCKFWTLIKVNLKSLGFLVRKIGTYFSEEFAVI